MPISLTQPTEGSVGWAAAVNQNFQDIQTAVNSAGAFLDNVFRVQDDSDPTKQVALDVSGVTTATTRTLTVPNSSGTIALTSQLPAGAALTKTDDTNVTLSLGGSPSTSLLNAASLTLGWSGQLSIARGGTGASSASAARTALGLAIGSDVQAALGIGTANQVLRTNAGATALEWASAPGATFERLSLTSTPTTILTSDKGKVVRNDYGTAAAEVDLPTNLATGSADALMYALLGKVHSGGAAQDSVVVDPGSAGYLYMPGLHAGAAGTKWRSMDDDAAMILWGARDTSNAVDAWNPLSLVGRWVVSATSPFVFGNDVSVNSFHNWGMLQATASGTFSRDGDMAAITISDSGGSTDGQDDSHGYYVATGTTGSAGVSEASTTSARFGQCHTFYVKFAVSSLGASGAAYLGWGSASHGSNPTNPFVGLRFSSTAGSASSAAEIYAVGPGGAIQTSTGWTPTFNSVYQLRIDLHFAASTTRAQWTIYDASGVRVYYGAADSTSLPAASGTARFYFGGLSSSPVLRTFTASRWARRAPG